MNQEVATMMANDAVWYRGADGEALTHEQTVRQLCDRLAGNPDALDPVGLSMVYEMVHGEALTPTMSADEVRQALVEAYTSRIRGLTWAGIGEEYAEVMGDLCELHWQMEEALADRYPDHVENLTGEELAEEFRRVTGKTVEIAANG